MPGYLFFVLWHSLVLNGKIQAFMRGCTVVIVPSCHFFVYQLEFFSNEAFSLLIIDTQWYGSFRKVFFLISILRFYVLLLNDSHSEKSSAYFWLRHFPCPLEANNMTSFLSDLPGLFYTPNYMHTLPCPAPFSI